MIPTRAHARAFILNLNYGVEFKNRLRAGDDLEVARKGAELVAMEIRADWEEVDRREDGEDPPHRVHPDEVP